MLQRWASMATGAAAPGDRSNPVDTLTSALHTSLYCLVTPDATRIPGRAPIAPATCSAAPCAGPLLHTDSGAPGRSDGWHASAAGRLHKADLVF
jgi:hypothetical protein